MIATVVCGVIFFVLSYVSQLVFPSNQFADVDSGSLDVMTSAGGQFLEHVLHRRLHRGLHRLGAHLAGVGGQDPVRDGTRRHPAAQGVRPRVRPVLHADVRDPGGVGDLAAALVDRSGYLASMVSFGALVAFSAVNLSVIKHYFVDSRA